MRAVLPFRGKTVVSCTKRLFYRVSERISPHPPRSSTMEHSAYTNTSHGRRHQIGSLWGAVYKQIVFGEQKNLPRARMHGHRANPLNKCIRCKLGTTPCTREFGISKVFGPFPKPNQRSCISRPDPHSLTPIRLGNLLRQPLLPCRRVGRRPHPRPSPCLRLPALPRLDRAL